MNRFILIFCIFFHSATFALETIHSPNDCYTVIEKLGEGVFGEVFAVENSQGEKFAIKCYKIHEDSVFADHRYTDVEREYQRGRVLDHPNIIKSYDLFSDQVTNYLVLELVEGKNLQKTKRGDIRRQESLEATFHFCEAIDYALSLGYFHLDLHEGNAMFSQDSDIKIIDLASFYSMKELYHFVGETTEEESLVDSKQEKIGAFFLKNPLLFKKLKAESFSESKSSEYDQEAHIRSIFSAHYFGQFSEFLQKIIEKSDFSRNERLALCLKLKELAWNYSEDVKTIHNVSYDIYFSDLMNCLGSLDD